MEEMDKTQKNDQEDEGIYTGKQEYQKGKA